MKPIQVGLLGIGCVGSGVVQRAAATQPEIHRRAGRAASGVRRFARPGYDALLHREWKARVVGDALK